MRITPTQGDGEPFVITSDRFLLCTGASPRIPDWLEGKAVPYFTYENIFSLKQLPEHLVVVGGGPIGSELAQAFRRLGANVTVAARKVLPKEEPAASDVIPKVFE